MLMARVLDVDAIKGTGYNIFIRDSYSMLLGQQGGNTVQLHQLKQFCVIARCEHISQAAAELFISQPTLTMNLQRLETELGVPLFDRVGRNIRLNHNGRRFYRHVEEALKELDTAKQELQEEATRPAAFADALFNDTFTMLQQYLALDPNVKVVHLILTIPEILARLEDGSLDFGLMIIPKDRKLGKQFAWKPLWETNLVALVSEQHPLAKRGSIRLEELKNDEFICATSGFDSRDAFDYFCRLAGFHPTYRYTSVKPYLFNDLTRQYGSISLMSRIMYETHHVARENKTGLRTDLTGITALALTEPDCTVQFGMVTCREHMLTENAKKLMRYVQEYFSTHVGLF